MTTSRVSLLGTTGMISNVTPVPRQLSTHSCKSRRSSQRISWKQRAKLGSTQLSTYSRPAGCVSACNFDPLMRGIGVQF
jgi:hypothetical protein